MRLTPEDLRQLRENAVANGYTITRDDSEVLSYEKRFDRPKPKRRKKVTLPERGCCDNCYCLREARARKETKKR